MYDKSKEGIIHDLYNERECESIENLYKTEQNLKKLIVNAIGNKLIISSEKFVNTNLINALYLICLTAKFADSEDECYRVAITVCQSYNKPNNILPSICFDRGLILANKILVALSLYPQALEKKWKFKGAPSVEFYRNTSKHIYKKYNQLDISNHHEQWEMFLGERLI